jgi:hypothetical protein
MADKDQIGLTTAGSAVMDRLLGRGYFSGKDEAAKFAAALAMERGMVAEPVRGATTTWNARTLDATGELKTAILLLYDHPEPYRALEGLMDAGLQLLGDHMTERGDLVLSELLTPND